MDQPRMARKDDNPYKAPSEPIPGTRYDVDLEFPEATAEALRKSYGAYEASIRSVSLFLYLMAGTSILGLILKFGITLSQQEVAGEDPSVAAPSERVRNIAIVIGLVSASIDILLADFLGKLHGLARWAEIFH